MKSEIDKRVAERLPLVVFDKLMKEHMRYGFNTDCECSYCANKRNLSRAFSLLPYMKIVMGERLSYGFCDDWDDVKVEATLLARRDIRRKLEELENLGFICDDPKS